MLIGVFMMAPDIPMDVTGVVMVVFGFGGAFKPARCKAPATEIGLGAAVGVVVVVVLVGCVPPPSGGMPPGGRGLFGGVPIGVGWFTRCTGVAGVAA